MTAAMAGIKTLAIDKVEQRRLTGSSISPTVVLTWCGVQLRHVV